MRVVRVTNHFIVRPVGNDPLILTVLDFECVEELLLKRVGIFVDEELRLLAKVRHALCVIGASFVLCKGIFVLALLLAHFTVELVLSQHFLFTIIIVFNE